MISIKKLQFRFKHPILQNINLEIKNQHQVIALLGPNGSGKTTFMNVLSNFYQQYQGQVAISGKVFLLPDSNFLPPYMTIQSCLQEFPTLYNNFNVERAKKMLEFLKLDVNKKISDYSLGMKEQLHLVFALSQDVDVYLLDEPLAAVDPLTRDVLIEMIQNYRRENSIVIISTHLISDMERLFDEIIMLNLGKIILYSDVNELLQKYPNSSLDHIYKEVQRQI